jgi:hypothetical protein
VVEKSQEPPDIDDTASIPVYSDDGVEEQPTDQARVGNDASDSEPQGSLNLPDSDITESSPAVMRFDDDTPLPDDFDDLPDSPATPQRRAEDQLEAQHQLVDDLQEDLELGEPDDWEHLLDEVEVNASRSEADISMDVEEELAAIHSELSERGDAPPNSDLANDDSPTADIPLYAETESNTGHYADDEEDDAALPEGDLAEPGDDPATAKSLHESTGSFEKQIAIARDEIDRQLDGDDEADAKDPAAAETVDPAELTDIAQDDHADNALELELAAFDDKEPPETKADNEVVGEIEKDTDVEHQLEATIAGVPASLLAEGSDNVETIIMEGEFVHGSIQKQERATDPAIASKLDDPDSLVDTYAIQRGQVRGGRRRGDAPSAGVVAAITILTLVLVGQLLHANREALSTYGTFNQTLGSVYRMAGNPVTPEWNIKGWRFEATNGSTDEEEKLLTIVSRIINHSDQPLPYPLVHISLTDRWEEIIGSRVLEPNEYLAGDLDPSRPVGAGENFTAVITVESPSTDATGFKLNVCYRVTSGRVRCATEDFKD